jgi:hypothetical protein
VAPLTGYFPIEDDGSFELSRKANCFVVLKDMSRVSARVDFDFPSDYDPVQNSATSGEDRVCYVLLITAREGIAIKVVEEEPVKYERVGHLFIYKTGRDFPNDFRRCGKDLYITEFPDVKSIILV